ncbi:MAG: uncharacterized protein JWQ11_4744, partial [Rhizobacter sp.]|nr:uncharacterized protein [Rhizobacter sp.]
CSSALLAACGGGGAGPSADATPASVTVSADDSAISVHALATTDGTTWTKTADENASFTVSGTQTVRYGSGSNWVTKTVTGSVTCSNAWFGSDPIPYTYKECDLSSAAATTTADATTWTRIAVENAAFTVSGTQTVRYGAGAAWVTKSVTGSGTCSNGWFGNDPIVGTVKECDVSTAATAVATAAVCSVPLSPTVLASTAATVGNGTAASCTEAALRAAVDASSVVRFNCGAAPATIRIANTIVLPTTRNTTIDGGNLVTLDGGGTTRILSMVQNNYRTNTLGLTLQHIALANGRATGGGYVAPDASNASCAYGYATGSGAAIQLQDASLHVFDVQFTNNTAATPGPDVGGGAIYAGGSLDVLIAGSTFTGNTGANSGAVGMLNSNLRVYNSVFSGNAANGIGQNYASAASASCRGVGHPGQGGAGGNGGAIFIDGGSDTDVIVCGSTFSGNKAGELAGALGRTPDIDPRSTTIDRSTFTGNSAKTAGAIYVMNSQPLNILASTFSANTALGGGAAQLNGNQLNIVNSTFTGNVASQGVGGALLLFGNLDSSVIRNATFANNQTHGGSGYFSAAIFGDSNVQVFNTVFANNTTADPWNPMQCGFAAFAGSADFQWPRNRSAGGAADTLCVAGITFADPLLGALASGSGPTPTMAPAAASPLRKAGRDCPTTDQRGVARNTAACTVGAVE